MAASEKDLLTGVRQEWEKLPEESGIAFDAFKFFLDLGITRTVAEAYRGKTGRKKVKKAPGAWYEWATKFKWYPRAEAFDRYVAAIEAREEERAYAERRRLWIQRRGEVQDSAWTLAAALEEKAREILALPAVQKTETHTEEKDGKTVTVTVTHNPVRATYSDAIRAAETADRLKRLAVGMATERVVSKSASAELAETLEDARRAFREARELFRDSESVEETARNIAAAYALDAAQVLEGYNEAAPPLATEANN